MKFPNRPDSQGNAVTNLTDVNFDKSERFYERFIAKMYLFLDLNTILISNNAERSQKNLLKN